MHRKQPRSEDIGTNGRAECSDSRVPRLRTVRFDLGESAVPGMRQYDVCNDSDGAAR